MGRERKEEIFFPFLPPNSFERERKNKNEDRERKQKLLHSFCSQPLYFCNYVIALNNQTTF